MTEKPKPLLYQTLRVLFQYPIVILMVGGWRKGKTDTSLLMAKLSKKWGLIDKIGSNIWTFNNPEVEYIISLNKLRAWLHADKSTKLFIFDEGLKHVYRRTAMSKKNIGVIDILAELSKGHGRMIFCSQTLKIDSDILDPVFCRAKWEKKSKKVMACTSVHHPPRTFRNLPRSPIRFDPDRLAPFIDKDVSKVFQNSETDQLYRVVTLYEEGCSFRQIAKREKLHPEQVRREVKKALAWFKEHYEGFEGEKKVSQIEH